MNETKRISPQDISLIVYDFDGVMTDNKVLITEDGKEAVVCHRADGMAVSKIKEKGIPQMILSTEKNKVLEARAKKLNIEVFYGVNDKKAFLIDYCNGKNYSLKNVVYIGNDLNDLDVMNIVGFPLAPEDACQKVKDIAKIIFTKKGGEGVLDFLADSLF